MKIITFASHQPYLHLFRGMDLSFDIIQIQEQRRFLQNWDNRVRPLPPGWNLISFADARHNLENQAYDLAIAHNINDYIDFMPYRLPKIVVFHSTLSGRIAEEASQIDPAQYKAEISKLLAHHPVHMVFVSQMKKQDWGFPGSVIPPGCSLEDYPENTGEKAAILRVSNHLLERADILDYPAHQFLTRNLPCTLIGKNPSISNAFPAESWDALRAAFQSHRLFLHTAKPNMEDGYNLSLLEALTCGLPIITTPSPSSPVIDGYNGFISDDLNYLREKITLLLENRTLARELGANARRTAQQHFSMERFHLEWFTVFQKTIQRYLMQLTLEQ